MLLSANHNTGLEGDGTSVLCMSSDLVAENYLVTATSSRHLCVFDRATLKPLFSESAAANPAVHESRINDLTFGGPKMVYSASSDGTVKLWDVTQPLGKAAATSTLSSDLTAPHQYTHAMRKQQYTMRMSQSKPDM